MMGIVSADVGQGITLVIYHSILNCTHKHSCIILAPTYCYLGVFKTFDDDGLIKTYRIGRLEGLKRLQKRVHNQTFNVTLGISIIDSPNRGHLFSTPTI